MSKSKVVKLKEEESEKDFDSLYIIPIVTNTIEPKIKIWDANNSSYWFRKIGFNRDIRDED